MRPHIKYYLYDMHGKGTNNEQGTHRSATKQTFVNILSNNSLLYASNHSRIFRFNLCSWWDDWDHFKVLCKWSVFLQAALSSTCRRYRHNSVCQIIIVLPPKSLGNPWISWKLYFDWLNVVITRQLKLCLISQSNIVLMYLSWLCCRLM
jgi:hypothetical protein